MVHLNSAVYSDIDVKQAPLTCVYVLTLYIMFPDSAVSIHNHMLLTAGFTSSESITLQSAF